ncbi:MAG: AAA family ATPase [Proteobacteria bacterium]|nr:AAA family ATPase [Pseudomonadota bacterium]
MSSAIDRACSMTAAIAESGTAYSELVLRTTPPRAPRNLLVRSRLSLDDERFRERPVIVVQAPPGFGKTSLLAQWRHECLARGAAVAWISVDGRDDPLRFLHSLVLAVRVGCARPQFGRVLMEGGQASLGELDGITAWLAEVAQSSLDLVLIIDEAERLSAARRNGLSYLLHNAPANLRVVIAARAGFDAEVEDLSSYGHCELVGVEMLCFRLEETLSLVGNRFGSKVDADTCARLQEATEGWPLGLQLALAAMERSTDPRSAIEGLASGSGDQRHRLVDALMAHLAADDLDFLTRIAVVDLLHPDLCRALVGDDAEERLQRLSRDTPIFVVGDNSAWSRLHTLARDGLRARLGELPVDQQAGLHERAMGWLASHGMIEEAARHALAAGQREQAYDLAEQCLYDAVVQGHLGTVLEWLELVPDTERDKRPRLRLAAAWVLAVSERHAEAEVLVERILSQPNVDAALRYECALILSGAAYYADDPDQCAALFAPWRDTPPVREPRLLQMHANRQSVLAIVQGDPVAARRYQQAAPRGDYGKAHGYAVRWGEFATGLSYFWEGQMLLAEEALRPTLARLDADLGRRHPLACMVASLLASAVYERDRLDEASALLANRLDVLERGGTPETALFGYRTAARLAAAQGIEHRALDLLEALYSVGMARHLPRLCVAALAEQTRMHAGRFRSETCRALVERVDHILEGEGLPTGELWWRAARLPQLLTHAHAAIAEQNWPAALDALTRAMPLAEALKQGRVRIEIMALRAFALDRNGVDGRPVLHEALSLAQTYGLMRTFADAHPAMADWARRIAEEDDNGAAADRPVPIARTVRPAPDLKAGGPRAVPSMVLTPKEREILELLARNLSNKEIAQSLAVGEATVKWHLKNLFGKLGAGTRRHVVRRAQVLGLLEGVE